MVDLNFTVESAGVLEYAASPSLQFKLRIENAGGEAVRSVALATQIRIAANRRHYSPEEETRLWEVFGAKERWGETLKSLLWTHTNILIPGFSGSTTIEMPVPCTYDFDVVSAKYFHSLRDGVIPLEFLFSGTVFYAGEQGLQIVQISWEKEAQFSLPVSVWQQMMEHYFPNSAWLRVRKDVFDRLYQFKNDNGAGSWEAALELLLRDAEKNKE